MSWRLASSAIPYNSRIWINLDEVERNRASVRKKRETNVDGREPLFTVTL
jgi:hypothetical protein